MTETILLADDDTLVRQSVKMALAGEGYQLIEASTLEETRSAVQKLSPDLLLLDVHFSNGQTSLPLLETVLRENSNLPVLILSGAATATEAAKAIMLGAYDFIEKPASPERLRVSVRKCLEHALLKSSFLKFAVQDNQNNDFIGASQATQKIKKQVATFAATDSKILITGETGVGKEVVARSLWKTSTRQNKPFIVVNAAAIPDSLVESELFGHKRGSFTGAIADQVGKIEMADNGTLFLDEIGDLSASAQNKLLRFIDAGEIQKVGSNQIKKVDVRILAATSRNLEKEVQEGRFRSDLYYRLDVVRIEIPPLRLRKDDLAQLFAYFVSHFCTKMKVNPKTLETDALELLLAYDWPGNIRELRNIAEKAVVISDSKITRAHVLDSLGQRKVSPETKAHEDTTQASEFMSLKDFKAKAEKEYIAKALAHVGGSVTKAAQLLKIDRTYLHQKMTALGLTEK